MEISVIVPAFNAENYIGRCLNSITSQTFQDFEIIFVDDGSTDKTLIVAKSLALSDSRIKVVQQDNAGVSSARNTGIRWSKGKYITFVDSDDWISSDYLFVLYEAIKKQQTDIVLSGIVDMIGNEESKRTILAYKRFSLDSEHDLVSFFCTCLQSSPVAKLYRRDVIVENSIEFDSSISFAEDRDFNLKYFKNIHTACSLSFFGYFYQRDVAGSLSKKKYDYVYSLEIRHWGMKKEQFLLRGIHGYESQRYLAQQLYYVMTDSLYGIGTSDGQLVGKKKQWSRVLADLDLEYLRQHLSQVTAPFWIKRLIFFEQYTLLLSFVHLKWKINGNTEN